MDRKGQFVDVVAWGRSAEIVRDYTKKGSTILVEGRLKQETWEREGEKRSRVKIVVDRVVLLSSNSSGGRANGKYDRPTKSYAPSSNNAGAAGNMKPFTRTVGGVGFTNAPPTSNVADLAAFYSPDGTDDISF